MAKGKKRKRAGEGTRLEDHHREGKRLIPPYARLPASVSLSSWRDERLPELVWVALICSSFEREQYLEIFRTLASSAKSHGELKFDGMGHSQLAMLSGGEFDALLAPVLQNGAVLAKLTPLRLLPALPDREHWLRHLSELEDTEAGWLALAEAIAPNLWHQSESATDIRWLRVLTMMSAGKMIYPEHMADLANEIVAYPQLGDMRKVRPSIRAAEMAFCHLNVKDRLSDWPEVFWKNCLTSKKCISAPLRSPDSVDVSEMIDEAVRLYARVSEHFHSSITTTDIDDRLDGVFGLSLYALVVQVTMLSSGSHQRLQGRLLLRTLVEVYITLAFLIRKDESVFWKRYRNYGNGQAKLAYLKLLDLDSNETPSYVQSNELEQLANEDRWQEFVEIDLGSWSKLDLRKMSEEAGVKDVYDRFYTWPSGYIHGQWAAVRDTVLDLCVNPLHRYHRIPSPPRFDMGSVAPDGVKLINLVLDLLNQAYPSFRHRAKVKEGVPAQGEVEAQ